MASSETRDTIESRGNVDVAAIENGFIRKNFGQNLTSDGHGIDC